MADFLVMVIHFTVLMIYVMRVIEKVLSLTQNEELELNIFNWDLGDDQAICKLVPKMLTAEHQLERVDISRTLLLDSSRLGLELFERLLCVCMYIYIYIYIYIYTHKSRSKSSKIRLRTFWTTFVCVYIYIYIYTHTQKSFKKF